MKVLSITRPLRNAVCGCLLAASACAGLGFRSTLHAASITAYRDASGRVVFVNEPANDTAPAPSTASPAAKNAPAQDSKSHALAMPPQAPSQAAQEQPKQGGGVLASFRSAWDELIELTARRHQVDPKLVRAIVRVESNFNPYAVSPRGARGLMQLIPATARRFGVRNVFDPKANLDGGVRYLKYLMELYGGDLKLSLAAYNAGENAVGGHNGVPPYAETQDYLRKISELYPLSIAPPKLGAPGIERYVDSNGIVHFSNTDQ